MRLLWCSPSSPGKRWRSIGGPRLLVLAVTTAALVLYSLRDFSGSPVWFTWIGAILAVSVAQRPRPGMGSRCGVDGGDRRHRRRRLDGVRRRPLNEAPWSIAALFVSWAVGALLLGGSVRGRRAERAALEERALHLAESREETRRRVAEERVRIARDLHDSVAHSMASISVQAGVGARAGRTAGGRPGLPAGHQARQPRRAGRAAGDAEHAALERVCIREPAAGARPAGLAGRELARPESTS